MSNEVRKIGVIGAGQNTAVGAGDVTPHKIGVVGAGTMGAGIARCAAACGIATAIFDPDTSAVTRVTAGAGIGPLRPAADLDDFADCGLVIEAAPESLDLKRGLFGQLASLTGETTILATNTSSLRVGEIAAGLPSPERVVGMHFFNPATTMKLVEVVATDESSATALTTAQAVATAMGKEWIATRDLPGFVVNRCNRPFTLEGLRLVEEGLAEPIEVDSACRAIGFRMGPFELIDLIGVDVNLDVARSLYEQSGNEPRWQPSQLQAKLVGEGRLGRKSGVGFYRYDARGRRLGDREVPVGSDLQRRIGDRIVCQLVNEAAFALGNEVASAADIDKGMRLGLNYPHGPLEWGELLGLEHVRSVLAALADEIDPERYRAAPRLATGNLTEI